MDVLSMRQRVANAIKAGEDSHMVFGQFDYSSYGRRPPYVVRDFRKEDQIVFESHDQDVVSKKYDELVMSYHVDLILAELEKPTDGMVEALQDECDALGVMLHPKEAAKLIAAAIRAAREGK